jgi:predicted PurR-regulated permease PerM
VEQSRGGHALVLIGVGLLLILLFKILAPIAGPLAIGAMIGSLVDPLAGPLTRWLGGRRRLASLILSLAVGASVVLPMAAVTSLAIGQLVELITSLGRRQAQSGGWEHLLTDQLHVPISQIERVAAEAAQRLLPLLQAVATNAIGLLLSLMLLMVTIYATLAEGRRWLSALARIPPLGSPSARLFVDEFGAVSRAVVLGSYVTAILHGVAGGFAFLLFGLHRAVLWGAVMAVASLVPGIGTSLIWGPAAILLAAEGHWSRAIGLVLYGTLVMGGIDYLARPWLSHGTMRLPEYGVFIAMIGGVAGFGFSGLFLGPMVFSLGLVALSVVARQGPAKS